jgi:hypothetical protein
MLSTSSRKRITGLLLLLGLLSIGGSRGQAATLCNGCTFNYSTSISIPSDDGTYHLRHYTESGHYGIYFNRSMCQAYYNNWTSWNDGSSSGCQSGDLGSHVNQWGNGDSGNWLAMQSDGNLVLYNGSGSAIWDSSTNVYGSSTFLNVQNDANLVLYYNTNVAIWSIV